MSLLEALRTAWDGVASNKLRAFLTTLGVVIGVAAVISLVAVAQGGTQRITEQISAMGSNLIMVRATSAYAALTIEDAESLDSRVLSLAGVAPEYSLRGTLKWGLTTYDATIEGASGSSLAVRNRELAAGRNLTDADLSNNAKVAIVGHTLYEELFKGRNPVGEEIYVHGQRFMVIGLLAEKSATIGSDPNNVVIIPITTALRLAGTNQLTAIYCQVSNANLAAATKAHIEAIFERQFGREGLVYVQSQDEMLEALTTATQTAAMMLGAIAGISLVVGGIGIMNIMLVSVTERTREIGLRKAVGARRKDIMRQFLIEAVTLSMGGGLIGVLIGLALARAIARFGSWSVVVSSSSVAISFGFSAAVGIVFGLYPAMKASRLDPIRALRYE